MDLFKILGGAAMGVIAVAALPVAGAVGTVALGGGLAAAGLGAAIGAVADEMDDTEGEAERRGEREATAKHDKELEKLLLNFNHVEKRLNENGNYFDGIVAMSAIGIACANCDGKISDEEKQDIEEFIAGTSHNKLPLNIKEKIEKMWIDPPNVNTAFELANNLGLDSLELFSEIIEITIHSDGDVHENELVFQQAWNRLVAA